MLRKMQNVQLTDLNFLTEYKMQYTILTMCIYMLL